jgi:hypothetical protein
MTSPINMVQQMKEVSQNDETISSQMKQNYPVAH